MLIHYLQLDKVGNLLNKNVVISTVDTTTIDNNIHNNNKFIVITTNDHTSGLSTALTIGYTINEPIIYINCYKHNGINVTLLNAILNINTFMTIIFDNLLITHIDKTIMGILQKYHNRVKFICTSTHTTAEIEQVMIENL
jgi:hypothetical protein